MFVKKMVLYRIYTNATGFKLTQICLNYCITRYFYTEQEKYCKFFFFGKLFKTGELLELGLVLFSQHEYYER